MNGTHVTIGQLMILAGILGVLRFAAGMRTNTRHSKRIAKWRLPAIAYTLGSGSVLSVPGAYDATDLGQLLVTAGALGAAAAMCGSGINADEDAMPFVPPLTLVCLASLTCGLTLNAIVTLAAYHA